MGGFWNRTGSNLTSQGGITIESLDKALTAARAAQERKGTNLSILNVAGLCSYADVILIVSATNERQTIAIADGIAEQLKHEGIRPQFSEGHGDWVLLDYGDLVVHVFMEETRAYYDIDRLWAEAPRTPVPTLAPTVMMEPPIAAFARRR